MEKKASCILPSPAESKVISYEGHDPEVWLGELEEGIKITYKAHSNQIGYLQLLTTHAQQNITFHCKNTVAYFDQHKRTFRKGLKLMAWNDAELLPKGNNRLRYEALVDDCRVSFDNTEKY